MTQLTLGFGTHHMCSHEVRAIRQCGAEWECDEPDCVGRLAEACPSCANFPRPHSTWWVNCAKREPAIAAKLQRIAARSARPALVVPA